MDDELEKRWNRNEQKRVDGLGWGLIKPGYFTHPHEVVAATVYVVGTIISLLMIWAFFASGWTLLLGLADAAKGAENARNLMLSIGAMVAAPFIVWRTWIAHQQWLVGVRQSDTQNQTMHSTMLTKAIELLGTMREEKTAYQNPDGTLEPRTETVPNIEVRLGAIYLLRRLAEDNARDHAPIIETLCDYIRQNSLQEKQKWERTRKSEDELPSPRADIQGAINAVGNKELAALSILRTIQPQKTLSGAFLPNYVFENLDFSYSNFASSDLRNAKFIGDSVMKNIDFGLSNLKSTYFSNSDFRNSNFFGVELFDAMFTNANLKGSNFLGNCFSSVIFSNSNITKSDFRSAVLYNTRFIVSDLTVADFMNAHFFEESTIRVLKLTHADFDGADLSVLRELTQEQLETCFGNTDTKLPPGLFPGSNPIYWSSDASNRDALRYELKKLVREAASDGATHEDLVALVKSYASAYPSSGLRPPSPTRGEGDTN